MAESQDASQGLPATSSTVLSSGSNVVTLSSVSAATPAPGRRPLTEAEKVLLLRIVDKRKVAKKTVMDELGLPRLDGSLWMAVRQGTTVSDDMLERLALWLDVHAAVLAAAAYQSFSHDQEPQRDLPERDETAQSCRRTYGRSDNRPDHFWRKEKRRRNVRRKYSFHWRGCCRRRHWLRVEGQLR